MATTPGSSHSQVPGDLSSIPGDGGHTCHTESDVDGDDDDQVGSPHSTGTSDEENLDLSDEEDAAGSAIINLWDLTYNNFNDSKPDGQKASQIEIEAILNKDYNQVIVKPLLPPVSQWLADAVTRWCHVTPPHEKIKEIFKKTLLPENVYSLKLVHINEILYEKLAMRAKVNDQCLRGINSYFTHGVGPLISMLDQLVAFEAELAVAKPKHVGATGTTLNIEGSSVHLNITELGHLLDKSCHLLCMGNAVTLQKRKSWLKGYLDSRYHYLTKASNPVTTDLLGPNLDQKINESNKVMEAARKIYARTDRFQQGNLNSRKFSLRGRSQHPAAGDRNGQEAPRGAHTFSPHRQW